MSLAEIIDNSREAVIKHLKSRLTPSLFEVFITIEGNYSKYFTFYYCYFSLFNANKKSAIKRNIDVSGYLQYISVKLLDNYFDKDSDFSVSLYQLALALRDESVLLLEQIFPPASPFWIKYHQRYEEFFKQFKNYKDDSLQHFETMADWKASIAKIAIDANYELTKNITEQSGQNSNYQALLKSHYWFSCGLQLMDDLIDLEQDVKHRNYNYLLLQLKNRLTDETTDFNTLKAEIYQSDFGSEIFSQIDQYFDKATQALNSMLQDLPWLEVIAIGKSYNQVIRSQLEGIQRQMVLNQRTQKAQIGLGSGLNRNEIASRIKLGLSYLTDTQDSEGNWQDYITARGSSDSWVTGFVSFQIASIVDGLGVDNSFSQKAIRYLKRAKKEEKLWGYNEYALSDADSSTCALFALAENGNDISESIHPWLAFRTSSGMFATFNDRQGLIREMNYTERDVEGWIQPHWCVTALALYFLSNQSKYEITLCEFQNDFDFSSINSYWWTSPIYSLSFLIRSCGGKGQSEIQDQLLEGLLTHQNRDGSFGDHFQTGNAFYSGLALSAMCNNQRISHQCREKSRLTAKWLLENQFSCGSFAPSTSMRLPSPKIKEPSKVENWKFSKVGTNIIVKDVFRSFSTSTAIRGLYDYQTSLND